MKLHWIIPLTVDVAFQFTSKNEMARAFRRLGHEISTTVGYVNNKTELDGFTGVDYIHTPAKSVFRKLLFHWKLLMSVRTSKADVVMFGVQAAHLIPFAWLLRFAKRPKLILDIRTVPVDLKGLRGRIETWRYKFSLRMADWFCDGITVITPMLGDTVRPDLKRIRNRMGIWTSGVNLDQFEHDGENRRDELGLTGKQVLLYHGVLSPNRGLQNAMLAMADLRDEFPDLVFLFVGDGAGKAELEQLAVELNLSDRVIFTGKVPFKDVASYIRSADMSILPFPDITWWAVSSPIKLMEYLATGIPIVATDITANRWVVDKTGGAILAEGHEPDSLSCAIRSALTDGISPADRDVLEDTISWNKQAKELFIFTESL